MKCLLWSALLLLTACEKKPSAIAAVPVAAQATRPAPEWQKHALLGYQVLRELPHDAQAYTQGLLLSGGEWVESTGGHGSSSIRRVEIATGKPRIQKNLAQEFFGEGIAEWNGKLYQLTWKSQQCFVYDSKTLQWQKTLNYAGEGWGLTTDGKSMILSNGSDRLRFLDPTTFRIQREIQVRRNGKPVDKLNELEFVEGEIFANVWFSKEIMRIHPADGTVLGVIDLSDIDAKETLRQEDFVLNGIAYDFEKQELYVTGKCWARIYQIKLVPKS
jgi:glutaminyl-peptide cyclotransferase